MNSVISNGEKSGDKRRGASRGGRGGANRGGQGGRYERETRAGQGGQGVSGGSLSPAHRALLVAAAMLPSRMKLGFRAQALPRQMVQWLDDCDAVTLQNVLIETLGRLDGNAGECEADAGSMNRRIKRRKI